MNFHFVFVFYSQMMKNRSGYLPLITQKNFLDTVLFKPYFVFSENVRFFSF
jgi:hypothetical protein